MEWHHHSNEDLRRQDYYQLLKIFYVPSTELIILYSWFHLILRLVVDIIHLFLDRKAKS